MGKYFNVYSAVFFLICVATLLNLFVPRFDTESSSVRLPVQIVSGLILVMMLPVCLFYRSKNFQSFSIIIYLFLGIITIHTVMGILNSHLPDGTVANMLRLASWMSSIIFFMKAFDSKKSFNDQLIRFYIFLFLIVAAKKLFETSLYTSDKLDAGDTAGLFLVLSVPAILCFYSDKFRLFVFLVAVALIFVSIRRTAILALGIASPFLFNEIKSKLRRIHVIIFSIVALTGLFYVWAAFGTQIATRFTGLISGDSAFGFKNSSIGSGRSVFWGIVYQSWLNSPIFNQFFGNGIGTISALLKAKYADIGHVHNDLLEILYTFGLFGLAIWLMIMYKLIAIIKYIKLYSKKHLNIYYSALILFLVVSLSSGTLFKIEMMVFAMPLALIIRETENNMNIAKIIGKQFNEENALRRKLKNFPEVKDTL